jgi:acid phosphatase
MDNDDFHSIPANVSTVVDLLDTKGISWAEYQEDIPYPGFEGFNFSNQHTYANDYVRKHDPLILYESVTNNATRLGLIQNFTGFETALNSKTLPQWAFITPNMTNDGHDTNVTFASTWERNWLAPLLNNSYFMNNTLVLVTWDEVETYSTPNKPFAVLLGGAIPEHLKGTTDDTFYTHYSTIATVSANWGLPSLGRWDCNANILQIVANKTGYANKIVDTKGLFMNASYPGPLSDDKYIPTWPNPETSGKCASGMGVLGAVANTYKGTTPTYNYTNPFPYSEAAGINSGVTVTNGTSGSPGSSTATTSSATSSATSSSSSSAAGSSSRTIKSVGVIGAFLATVVILQS